MTGDIQYEVYMEKYRITEWRDGCVYRTESLGYGWFDAEEAKAPQDKNIRYAAASTEVALTQMTIRRKRDDRAEAPGPGAGAPG